VSRAAAFARRYVAGGGAEVSHLRTFLTAQPGPANLEGAEYLIAGSPSSSRSMTAAFSFVAGTRVF
jgi:hypothetical protein